MTKVPVYRAELYFVLGLIILGILALARHEHNASVAQAAVFNAQRQQFEEQKAQDEAQRKQDAAAAQARLDAQQQQIALQQRQIDGEEQARQQLLVTLSTLNGQLSTLRQEESSRLAAVNAMPVDQLAKAVAAELGIKNAQYNPTTQTLTGVTPDALRKEQTQMVELDSCTQERDNLTRQASTCKQTTAADQALIETQASTIQTLKDELAVKAAADQQELASQKSEDGREIALLQSQVKVVRGTLVHRVWNRIKFPAGIAIGAGARLLLGF